MQRSIHPAVESRVRWLNRFLLVWGVAIFVRLFHLQILHNSDYTELAEGQQIKLLELPAHRGTIYDRNGHVLALTIPHEHVIVNPMLMEHPEFNAAILGEALGWNSQQTQQLAAELQAKKAKHIGYDRVALNITATQAQHLRGLHLKWIKFERSYVRAYPNDGLAAHVIGKVDHEYRGNGGVEQGLDDELAGRSGYVRTITDVNSNGLESQVEIEPVPGYDVSLTIDQRVQYELERSLAKAIETNGCWSGRGIVMDPRTGDIYAMASFPTYNLNDPKATIESRQNLAVSAPTEPGSVFKVFTIAGALEDKKVTPVTGYHCGLGKMNLAGRIIHDHDPYGYLSVEDILAKSSNIGAIRVGQELGEKRFHEYIKKFGFGQSTGLPLPGESPGRVIRLSKWTPSSIGSVAMGHEIMATTVQLAQAAGVIANGGRLVRPRLVRRINTPNDAGVQFRRVKATAFTPETEAPVEVLSPDTVVKMRNMMEHVVLAGTGKNAKVPQYSVGGKTGSAQMYDPKTKQYSHSRYHASFMGFMPVNNPQLVIVITLNGSTKYGGVVAGPVFSEVGAAAARILNIRPDLPDQPMTPAAEVIPVESDVAFSGLTEEKPVESEENLEVTTSQAVAVTPNFLGKTLRDVLEESSEKGLRIDPSGSGLVRQQHPAPGAPIAYGQKIKLKFGR
jgi:cell division protein FtsI (penicillin-binding protein 3)